MKLENVCFLLAKALFKIEIILKRITSIEILITAVQILCGEEEAVLHFAFRASQDCGLNITPTVVTQPAGHLYQGTKVQSRLAAAFKETSRKLRNSDSMRGDRAKSPLVVSAKETYFTTSENNRCLSLQLPGFKSIIASLLSFC